MHTAVYMKQNPFEGDGMVSAVTFSSGGRAHFRNRMVRTKGLEREEKAGMLSNYSTTKVYDTATAGSITACYIASHQISTGLKKFTALHLHKASFELATAIRIEQIHLVKLQLTSTVHTADTLHVCSCRQASAQHSSTVLASRLGSSIHREAQEHSKQRCCLLGTAVCSYVGGRAALED
jgi:Retinal pigment epithelial membrane protein